jgi:hypothetical protein
MTRKKTWYPALCAVLIAAVLTGCGLFTGRDGGASAAPAGFHQSSSAVSSAVSSSDPGSSSEDPPSSSPAVSSQDPNRPSDSQPGQVLPIQTDDKGFNEKFAANPIDKKYITESNQAVSNIDMIKVSDKYRDIWKAEVDHAYAELEKSMMADSSGKPEQYRAEQEKWRSEQKAALQKIADDAQAAGGSMAQVDEASKVMDYYRSRAAQLYRELYGYDKNYSYAYKEK